MLHALAQIKDIQPTQDDTLIISFEVEKTGDLLERVKSLNNKELVLEAKLYRPKRSLSANNYLWHLCGEMARVLHNESDVIYLMMLEGAKCQSEILEITSEAVEAFKQLYRVCVERYEYEFNDDLGNVKCMVGLECYTGSSQFDTAEMARLLDYTVQEAKALGVSVWTKEEIDNLLKNWEGNK